MVRRVLDVSPQRSSRRAPNHTRTWYRRRGVPGSRLPVYR
jgi:hypothetical protein